MNKRRRLKKEKLSNSDFAKMI
ncbi:MAG: hypothetical protein E7265_01590 [Lachnospiraceae bacterium]|nr:hypothetical protein [Lachnospiraceae bacterium]